MTRPRRQQIAAYGLAAASVVLLVVALWHESGRNRIDFHIYYEAVSTAPDSSLYDFRFRILGLGFTYPPFAALFIKPFTWVPFGIAEHIWLIATAVCSAVFLALVVDHTPLRDRPLIVRMAIVAAGLWTVPVFLTARIGQINAFVALLVLVDFVAVVQGRRWAGVLIGVATALKVTPGIAVAGLLAVRQFRAVAMSVVGFVAAGVAAAAVFPSDTVEYWTSTLFDTERVGFLWNPHNNSIRGFLTELPGPEAIQVALWVLAGIALVAVAYHRTQAAFAARNPLAAATIVMCCGAALSPISWSHHLYFLLPAVLLIAGDLGDRRRLIVAIALLPLLYEIDDPGQIELFVRLRAVVLPAIVLWLPIDTVKDRLHVAHRTQRPADRARDLRPA